MSNRVPILLFVTGLSGVALSFVPFAHGVTPFTDVFLDWDLADPLWLLVAPCVLLPVAVSIGYGLRLWTGGIPRPAEQFAGMLAALSALACLAGFLLSESNDAANVLMTILFAIGFGGGALLSIKGTIQQSGIRGLIAMQCAYVVPMSFWVAFACSENEMQPGAWLGVIALLSYFAQIGPAVTRYRWVLALLLPALAVFVLHLATAESW